MAMKNSDLAGKETLTESYSLSGKINQLRLYYVRVHNTKDNLQLQANFENKIVFKFDQENQLDDDNTLSPFIYTLDLQLTKDISGQLRVHHDGRWKPINRFQMQGIGPSLIKFKNVIYNEKGAQGHVLDNYFESEHCFLFDVQFDSNLARNFPGKRLFRRSSSFI